MKQIKEILPIFILSMSMGGFVFFIISFIENAYMQLIMGTLSGIIFILVFSLLFKIKELNAILSILKK